MLSKLDNERSPPPRCKGARVDLSGRFVVRHGDSLVLRSRCWHNFNRSKQPAPGGALAPSVNKTYVSELLSTDVAPLKARTAGGGMSSVWSARHFHTLLVIDFGLILSHNRERCQAGTGRPGVWAMIPSETQAHDLGEQVTAVL